MIEGILSKSVPKGGFMEGGRKGGRKCIVID